MVQIEVDFREESPFLRVWDLYREFLTFDRAPDDALIFCEMCLLALLPRKPFLSHSKIANPSGTYLSKRRFRDGRRICIALSEEHDARTIITWEWVLSECAAADTGSPPDRLVGIAFRYVILNAGHTLFYATRGTDLARLIKRLNPEE